VYEKFEEIIKKSNVYEGSSPGAILPEKFYFSPPTESTAF
jgi:hypothetical protein